MIVLNPHNLKNSQNFGISDKKSLKDFNHKISQTFGSTWIKFECFSTKIENNKKIITYAKKDVKNNMLKILDLSDFDF